MELGTFGLIAIVRVRLVYLPSTCSQHIAGQKVITVRYLLGSQAVSLRLLVRTAEVIGLCTLVDHGQKSKDNRLLETGVWRHRQCDILGKNTGIAVHVIDTKSILGTTLITDPAVHPWWTVCCPNGGASSFA